MESFSKGSCTTWMAPDFCMVFEQVITMCAPGGPHITSPNAGNLVLSKPERLSGHKDPSLKKPKKETRQRAT